MSDERREGITVAIEQVSKERLQKERLQEIDGINADMPMKEFFKKSDEKIFGQPKPGGQSISISQIAHSMINAMAKYLHDSEILYDDRLLQKFCDDFNDANAKRFAMGALSCPYPPQE